MSLFLAFSTAVMAQKANDAFPGNLQVAPQIIPFTQYLTDTAHRRIWWNNGYGQNSMMVTYQMLRDTLSHYVGVGGGMVYPGAGIPLSTGTAWATSITDNHTNWDAGFSQRLQWDGGATNLVASTARASLGLVIGTNVLAQRTFGTAANNNTGDFVATGANIALTDAGVATYSFTNTGFIANDLVTSNSTQLHPTNLLFYQNAAGFTNTLNANTTTANRTWSLPDKSGTIAMTGDITTSAINSLYGYTPANGANYLNLSTGGTITGGGGGFANISLTGDGLAVNNNSSPGKVSYGLGGIIFKDGSSLATGSISLTNVFSTTGTWYLPSDHYGTLAMTSDINTAVSGTINSIAKFTGSNGIGNSLITDNGSTVTIGTSADVTGAPVGSISNTLYDNSATSGVILGNMFRQNYTGAWTSGSNQGLENYQKLSGGNKNIALGIISNQEWAGTTGTAADIRAYQSGIIASSTGTTAITASNNYLSSAVASKSGAASGLTITAAYQFHATSFDTRGITYTNKWSFYGDSGAGVLNVADGAIFGGAVNTSGNTITGKTESPGTNSTALASTAFVLANSSTKPVVTNLTSQTASTTIATGSLAADVTYSVGAYVMVNSIAVDVLKVQYSWTALDGTVKTQDVFLQGSSPTNLMPTAGYYALPTLNIRAKSGTSISVIYALATGGGTINYDPTAIFEQLN